MPSQAKTTHGNIVNINPLKAERWLSKCLVSQKMRLKILTRVMVRKIKFEFVMLREILHKHFRMKPNSRIVETSNLCLDIRFNT